MTYPYEKTTRGSIDTMLRIETRLEKEKARKAELEAKLYKTMKAVLETDEIISFMEHHLVYSFELTD
tara:strand:- start:253 stop:453 length:201 start_codon:yes stop_codon:yes gene_type:complete